jgi:hypothetical protein
MRWVCRAVVLLFPACFHPNYDRPACGPGGTCPSGLQCSAQGFCERPGSGAGSGDDAGIDAPGGGGGGDGGPIDTPPSGNGVCYGPSGWQVCLDAKAGGQVQIVGTLDTGTSTRCLSTLPSSWTASQPAACIVVGDTITVGSVSVTGNRPLVLVAETRITVTSLLDAASHHAGAVGAGAASSADCKPFGSVPGMGPPGGGGAGGGFMFPGGGGGRGNGVTSGSVPGGQAASGQVGAPTRLHGGCAGQPGGGGSASDGGAGGGAVYLVSAGAISISGKIDVSGAGGKGRDARIGGGGAGSGGVIVLFAPSISTMQSTLLIANGGGGGGGSSALDVSQDTSKGDDGLEPVSPTAPASGGAGGQRDGFNGGDGGQGYPAASNTNPGLSGNTGDIGAGGGGGGGGGGYIRSNQALGAAAVSPAPDIKP